MRLLILIVLILHTTGCNSLVLDQVQIKSPVFVLTWNVQKDLLSDISLLKKELLKRKPEVYVKENGEIGNLVEVLGDDVFKVILKDGKVKIFEREDLVLLE